MFNWELSHTKSLIGDPRAAASAIPPRPAAPPPPLPVKIWLDMFFQKSTHLGGWHPSPMGSAPLTENPGSATVSGNF